MAESVVSYLLQRIGSALTVELVKSTCSILTTEACVMSKFFHEVKGIQDELTRIRGYLQEAEKFREMDANTKNFILEIRKVAFKIEDIIDIFAYKLDEQNRGLVSKTIKRVVHIRIWYKLTDKLKKIKSDLAGIQTRNDRYAIVTRGALDGKKWRRADERDLVKEGVFVGINENKKKLMKLLNKEKKTCNLITVWGMGGVGKTTFVTDVYKAVKQSFEACALIQVSHIQGGKLLLRTLLQELHAEHKTEISIDGIDSMELPSLVGKVRDFLCNKRYLIILDDVWTAEVWHCIVDCLPQGTGQIIFTTRTEEVALLAPKDQIVEVIRLNNQDSWDLFCKNAFRKNGIPACPLELINWVEKIVEKCGGHPLAISVIGSLMASKKEEEWDWKKMCDDLEQVVASNTEFKGILQLCYEDLSCNLKYCLLYWCTFPEDYEIGGVSLRNFWIAEGFIETSKNRTQDEVAQYYLNELVSRCLVQVAGVDINGRFKYKMHNIVHSLVVSKSEEEDFCFVLSKSRDLSSRVRRVSIQNCYLEDAIQHDYSLRSFNIFNSKISPAILRMILRTSKLLRVLNLDGISMETIPQEVFTLFNLCYLGLSNTGVKKLPKSIGRLKNLQFLWADGTKIVKLPNELTKLRRLRELVVMDYDIVIPNDAIDAFKGVMPPKNIGQLKELRALAYIKATEEVVENLENFKELTLLRISEIRSDMCENLFTAIMNMKHLKRLTIAAKDGEVLKLQALNTSASVIGISGKLERTSLNHFLKSLQDHESIRALVFCQTSLEESCLSHLQEIHSLTTLHLNWAYDGNRMCFHKASFPTLQEFGLESALQLQLIEINKGAMPNLRRLFISNCPGPEELPRGIEHLTKLETFRWTNPHKTLVDRVRKERTELQLSAGRKRILHVVKFYSAKSLHDPLERIDQEQPTLVPILDMAQLQSSNETNTAGTTKPRQEEKRIVSNSPEEKKIQPVQDQLDKGKGKAITITISEENSDSDDD